MRGFASLLPMLVRCVGRDVHLYAFQTSSRHGSSCDACAVSYERPLVFDVSRDRVRWHNGRLRPGKINYPRADGQRSFLSTASSANKGVRFFRGPPPFEKSESRGGEPCRIRWSSGHR